MEKFFLCAVDFFDGIGGDGIFRTNVNRNNQDKGHKLYMVCLPHHLCSIELVVVTSSDDNGNSNNFMNRKGRETFCLTCQWFLMVPEVTSLLNNNGENRALDKIEDS